MRLCAFGVCLVLCFFVLVFVFVYVIVWVCCVCVGEREEGGSGGGGGDGGWVGVVFVVPSAVSHRTAETEKLYQQKTRCVLGFGGLHEAAVHWRARSPTSTRQREWNFFLDG